MMYRFWMFFLKGFLLSLFAGVLVYVGITDLLSKLEKESKVFSLFSLSIGIFFVIIIIL